MKQILNILVTTSILTVLVSCFELPPDRVISGVALKLDGTPFDSSATVLATDARGRTARAKVNSDGTFGIKILETEYLHDNFHNGVRGNTFLQISDASESIELVVSGSQGKVNVNSITAAASQLLLKKFKVEIEEVFNAVEASMPNANDKDGQIEDEGVLADLSIITELKKDDLKEVAQVVIGAMFGYDSSGNTAVKVDNFLEGSKKAKEIYLLKAAAKVAKNIVSSAIEATNNPENISYLLNNQSFYEALGKEIANSGENLGATEFTELLVKTIQSEEVQMNLSLIAADLDAYVLAVNEDDATPFVVEIPVISMSPSTATLSISRNVDEISISAENVLLSDKTILTIRVFSSTEEMIALQIPVIFNGEIFELDANPIVATFYYGTEIKIENSAAMVNGKINLESIFAETKVALEEQEYPDYYLDYVPNTSNNLILTISSTSISRTDITNVPTYLETTAEIISSLAGVRFE